MYSFDLTRWPIVVVEQTASHTDAEFENYLRQLEVIYTRRQRFVYVEPLPAAMSVPPLKRIQRFVAWFDAHRAEADRWCIGSVSVIPNAAVRAAANFFIQASRSSVPRYFATDRADAMRWAEEKIAADKAPEGA